MKKYWFRAKKYGWGWGLPATWQGWLVFIAYIVFIIFDSIYIINHHLHAIKTFLIIYISHILIASLILGIIIYLTGEKPKWRWGKNRNNR